MRRITSVTILLLIYVSISPQNILALNMSENSPSLKMVYTESNPLDISSDFQLASYASSGTGSVMNPYVIENLNITFQPGTYWLTAGINIENCNSHFIIRDCLIQGEFSYNIVILYNDLGSILLDNLILRSSRWSNIFIQYSAHANVTNCVVSGSTSGYGIMFGVVDKGLIHKNTVFKNYAAGIDGGAGNILVKNNHVYKNDRGIVTGRDTEICYNTVEDNTGVGIGMYINSKRNIIHHNNFIDNNNGHCQARDDGTNNLFYEEDTEEGNYWDNHEDSSPYQIDGTSNNADPYPLRKPVRESTMSLITLILSLITLSSCSYVLMMKKNKKRKE